MNLISSDDISREHINRIFDIADDIKSERSEVSLKERAILALLFEKPSTRTRLALEVAVTQLGGTPLYIDTSMSQMKKWESIPDTARIVSSYCDFIAARLFYQTELEEFARNSSVPVINALTDMEHPVQALIDLYTLKQHVGNMRDVKIAFIGDIAANTANSLMLTAAKLGTEVSLVGPKENSPNNMYFNKAREFSKVHSYDSIEEGLQDADAVYCDTFVSMGQEADAEKRRKLFAPYQLNANTLSFASKDAYVMHCLPAHRGEEITEDVMNGPRSIVWEQVSNTPLLYKAVLLFLSENG